MGIRINKDIGYFLNKKNIKNILVKNYDDIIDDLYAVDVQFVEKMLAELEILEKPGERIGFSYAKIQLKSLLREQKEVVAQNTNIDKMITDLEVAEKANSQLDFTDSKNQLIEMKQNAKNIVFNDFVSTIYHHDSFKGIIFKTPELNQDSRFDDLIDYYEQIDNPKYTLQLLQQSMYPDNYYICIKDIELSKNAIEYYQHDNPRKPNLEVGDLVSSDKLHYLMLYQGVKSKHDRIKSWAYPIDGEEKYFHPYINAITYAAAKVSGILKPNISYVEFAQYLEPAIVTYWG